jgi:hypothetical protein
MRIFGICAFAILTLLSSTLLAQRGYTARTAEYLAATSDLAVRASILDITVNKYVPKNRDEERSASNFRTVTVLLNVTCCLKGTTDESIRFQITQRVGDERLAKWKESATKLFWFFETVAANENGITRIVPRSDHELWKSVVEPPNLSAERPPIMLLNVDLQPLTTEKEVQQSISQFVKRFGNTRIKGTSLPISHEIAGRSGMFQAVNKVLLPSNYKELQTKTK